MAVLKLGDPYPTIDGGGVTVTASQICTCGDGVVGVTLNYEPPKPLPHPLTPLNSVAFILRRAGCYGGRKPRRKDRR